MMDAFYAKTEKVEGAELGRGGSEEKEAETPEGCAFDEGGIIFGKIILLHVDDLIWSLSKTTGQGPCVSPCGEPGRGLYKEGGGTGTW